VCSSFAITEFCGTGSCCQPHAESASCDRERRQHPKGDRRARTCTNLAQFCKVLRGCLERIGFDGFGLYFSAGLPFGVEFDPLVAVNRTKIQYFWKSLPASSDTNWSLTIRLSKGNGKRLGGFTLYRKNAVSPLWMDLDVFTNNRILRRGRDLRRKDAESLDRRR